MKNKMIFYLGSSITRGHGGDADGVSFVETVTERGGFLMQKQAVSGTCLAVLEGRSDSYVERFANFDFSSKPDVLVLQLSSNDFRRGVPYGKIGDFDTSTVTGAIETLIKAAAEQGAKVLLWAGPIKETWVKYKEYGEYIKAMLEPLQKKWADALVILDLFNADGLEDRFLQADGLHPTKAGYEEFFTPRFLDVLNSI